MASNFAIAWPDAENAVTMSAQHSSRTREARKCVERAEITGRLRAHYASILAMPVPNSLNALIERRSAPETCRQPLSGRFDTSRDAFVCEWCEFFEWCGALRMVWAGRARSG